jgi:hypothetical protein
MKYFIEVLGTGLNKIKTFGNSQVGDKTPVVTFEPRMNTFEKAVVKNKAFPECLVIFHKSTK